MQYIQLNNNSYILKTSKGMANLTIKSFNYNKIKKLLENNATEEEILPLLKQPKLPEGIFEAYLLDSTNTLLYKHIKDDADPVIHYFNNMCSSTLPIDSKFLGVYASKEDLMMDWPEYIL